MRLLAIYALLFRLLLSFALFTWWMPPTADAQFTRPALPGTYTDIATPSSNPASGATTVYTKAGTLCALNPSGTETCTGAGGGGGLQLTTGTYFNLPATCTPNGANGIYEQTDGPYHLICTLANIFTAFLGSWGKVTVPPSGGWTSDNMGTTTIDSTNGYRSFVNMNTTGATALRVQFVSVPATPYAVVAGIRHNITGLTAGVAASTQAGYGVGFRDGTGKLVSLLLTVNTSSTPGGLAQADNWTNSTTAGANIFTLAFNVGATPREDYAPDLLTHDPAWFCITDDGTTNLSFQISADRRHWRQLGTTSRTGNFASGPTQIWWGGFPSSNALDLMLLDWTLNTAATCL